ncbi:hypothetical protein M758_10G154700 [Ceratodon purpureus]|nr:hypothetical protein M758_10G154700 [Ceratodon purpureus]
MKLTKSRSCALRSLPSAPARKKDGISKRRIPRPLLQVKNLQRRRFHSTLEVKAEDCTTVRDLKERIGIQHSLSVIMLLYRGVPLDDARLLENLLPDLRMGSPRFTVHTRVRPRTAIHNGVTVNVLDLNRKTFQVTLHSPDSTLMELKEAIRDHEGMSLDHIAVTYAGKQLTRDDYTLRECKLEQGCTVNLVGRLRGGFRPGGKLGIAPDIPQAVEFADLEDTSLVRKIRLNSRTAKVWRTCVEGLNVEGECWNEDCIAFRQMVIDRRGLTVFNLRDPVYCPCCKVAIRPLTCGFWNCVWMYEGRKTGAGAVYIESQFMKAGKINYERFDEVADGRATAEWSSMIITAKKLPSKKNMKAYYGSGECPICHEEFTASSSQCTAKCNHAFHYECVMEWQMRGNSCPMCRANLE